MSTKRTTYLAGPMEYCEDEGLPWRLEFREKLASIDVECIIPNEEEINISNQTELNVLKKENLDEYIRIMRVFIDMDLAFVHTVDFVVVGWEGQRMSGTVGEAQQAYLTGVPVYLVTSQPVHTTPGWFLACCTKVFSTCDELVEYLHPENLRV